MFEKIISLFEDRNTWVEVTAALIVAVVTFALKKFLLPSKPTPPIFNGGNGGSPTTVGNNNIAIGGAGGGNGPGGKGGDGGGSVHIGNNLFVLGGEGGEAGQLDRGGRGGRSGFEVLGVPNEQLPDGSWLWDRGKGGDGASPDNPETAQKPAEEIKQSSSELAVLPLTLRDVWDHLTDSKSTELQKVAFAKRNQDAKVVWQGFVSSVSPGYASDSDILVSLAEDNSEYPRRNVVFFHHDQMTTLLELHEGDYIVVTGNLHFTLSSSNPTVRLENAVLVSLRKK